MWNVRDDDRFYYKYVFFENDNWKVLKLKLFKKN